VRENDPITSIVSFQNTEFEPKSDDYFGNVSGFLQVTNTEKEQHFNNLSLLPSVSNF